MLPLDADCDSSFRAQNELNDCILLYVLVVRRPSLCCLVWWRTHVVGFRWLQQQAPGQVAAGGVNMPARARVVNDTNVVSSPGRMSVPRAV
jgi:hypothetical protein